MKSTFKNIVKNILIVGSLLLSNNSTFAMQNTTQPPQRLHNATQHWGGICWANSILQSLGQNEHFCKLVDNFQSLHPAWGAIHKLRSGQTLSQRKQIPCARGVVEYIRQQYKGSDAFAVTNFLINNLLQISGTNGRNFCYDHPNKCFHQTTVNIDGTGRIISRIDNIATPIIRTRTDNERFNFNANLIVAPELNLIVVNPTDNLHTKKILFDNIHLNRNALFGRIYNHTIGQENNLDIVVEPTGIVIKCSSDQGEHALAYVNHNGQWFLCSDDLIIESVGNSFEQMSYHLHNNLINYLNQKLEGAHFTEASPVLFFYEVKTQTPAPARQDAPSLTTTTTAPANPEDEAILKKVKEDKCAICISKLNEEENLSLLKPCGHIFCTECIQNYRKEQRTVQDHAGEDAANTTAAELRAMGHTQEEIAQLRQGAGGENVFAKKISNSICPTCRAQITEITNLSVTNNTIKREANKTITIQQQGTASAVHPAPAPAPAPQQEDDLALAIQASLQQQVNGGPTEEEQMRWAMMDNAHEAHAAAEEDDPELRAAIAASLENHQPAAAYGYDEQVARHAQIRQSAQQNGLDLHTVNEALRILPNAQSLDHLAETIFQLQGEHRQERQVAEQLIAQQEVEARFQHEAPRAGNDAVINQLVEMFGEEKREQIQAFINTNNLQNQSVEFITEIILENGLEQQPAPAPRVEQGNAQREAKREEFLQRLKKINNIYSYADSISEIEPAVTAYKQLVQEVKAHYNNPTIFSTITADVTSLTIKSTHFQALAAAIQQAR